MTDKEFCEQYRLNFKTDLSHLNNDDLLDCCFKEWDWESPHIEIGQFDSKTDNPICIDVPDSFFNAIRY